jgi:hypothetical protein
MADAANPDARKAGAWVIVWGVLLIVTGLVAIVIALLIASGWPDSSIGFVGTLIGILLMYGGVWRIVLGRALRTGVPSPA